MQFKKTLLAMMMFGATAAAQADYRAEILGSLSTVTEEYEVDSYDVGDRDYDIDHDYASFEGVFYIMPVSTAKGPLAEAAFLSKASEVRLIIDRHSYEFDFDDADGNEYDEDTNTLSGRAVIPAARIILEASLSRGETNCKGDCDNDSDDDGWMLGVGGYITDNITLVFNYEKYESDEEFEDFERDSYTVTYRQLIPLSGEQSLVIEPFVSLFEFENDDDGYSTDGDGAMVGVDVTWYITRQLGVYAGVAGIGGDDDEGEGGDAASHVGVNYFLNENFRIGGELISVSGEYEYDDFDYEVEYEGGGIEFNAAVRF
jgi:hypothetical protein